MKHIRKIISTVDRRYFGSCLRQLYWVLKPVNSLDRPIFLVGCSKSGTTMAGILFYAHPELGPVPPQAKSYESTSHFLNAVLVDNLFDVVAHNMEQKSIWDKRFPMGDVTLRTGAGLTLLQNPLDGIETKRLIADMTKDFRSKRFFVKQPFNLFRVHLIREIWPDSKILVIERDGRDVISSWGRKHDRWVKFGGYEQSIRTFAKKWNESIEHATQYQDQLGLYRFRYEDLISDPTRILRELFEYCEIEYKSTIYDQIVLRKDVGLWRSRIPDEFHPLVQELTRKNRIQLGYPD